MLQKGSIVAAKVDLLIFSQIPSALLPTQYKIGEVKKGIKFGLLQSLNFVTGYAYVQLYSPTLYLGKTQYYGFVKLTDIVESGIFSGTGTKYYVGTNVNSVLNIRNSGSATGTIHAKLQRGSLIGTRIDSTETNGFWKFNLATGGIGYASAKYVTSTAPITSTSTPADTTTESVDNPITNGGKWSVMEIVQKGLIAVVVFFGARLIIKKFTN